MGVLQETYDLLMRYATPGCRIVELGNQTIFFQIQGMYGRPLKELLVRDGYDHVSIDLNGKDGALPHDLSAPIKGIAPGDIVTDFGTSEHVKDSFYACWKNKHDLCKSGGVILSVSPETGNWPGHGHHYLTYEFYERLARIARYEILELFRFPACNNTKDGWEVRCAIRRSVGQFPKKNIFRTLPVSSS